MSAITAIMPITLPRVDKICLVDPIDHMNHNVEHASLVDLEDRDDHSPSRISGLYDARLFVKPGQFSGF